MELTAGYKQTELGVIPEDWEVKELKELFLITAGGDLRKNEYSKVKTTNYKYKIFSNSIKNKGLYGYSTTYDYQGNYITITARGFIGYTVARKNCFCAIGRLLVLKPLDDLNCKFFEEYINSYLIFALESTGIPQLTAPQISNYKVIVPKKTEQTTIAKVLTDVDDLLESLDKLIAKKRDIKQATMQQLLTGKTRLPSFANNQGNKQTELGVIPEDWEVVKLGNISFIKTGSKNNEDKKINGKYPFFVRSEVVESINSYSYNCEAVLIPGEGRIGEIFHYIKGRFDVHQRVYVINQLNKNYSTKFLFFYLAKNFGSWAMKNTVKATVDSLRLPTFQNFQLLQPTKTEQTAIAKVLTEIDDEIEALEQRRNKLTNLKQGMMQQLLTGKIRLIKPKQHKE